MPKFKFTLSRRSITLETYEIEADTEEEALEAANEGYLGDPLLEWVDWYDGAYDIDSQEAIDPLYKMVKAYEEKTVDIVDS